MTHLDVGSLADVIPFDRARKPEPAPEPPPVQLDRMRAELIASEINRADVRAVIGDDHATTIISWLVGDPPVTINPRHPSMRPPDGPA